MRRLISTASLLLIAASTLACSEPADDGGEDTTGGTGQGGSSGASTGGSAGAATGGASGVSTGGAAMTGGSSTGGSAGSATGGSGGSAGGGFTKTGNCRQAGKASVMATTYEDGQEDFYILSEEALEEGLTEPAPGNLVCQIRFDVTRSGEAPAGCVDLEDMPCLWSQEVQYGNPTVLVDVDGACARSELGWSMTWASGITGTRVSYGYIDMYEGHQSVVMKNTGAAWRQFGAAFWDSMTGEFDYEAILGPCQY